MMMMMIVINVRGSNCHPESPRGYEDVLSSGIIYKVNKVYPRKQLLPARRLD
jgi:hypothetical protein